MTPEIRKAFHEELDELRQQVVHLGNLAVESIRNGTRAFLSGDVTEAENVIANDIEIDKLMVEIEMRSCELLARQQPMAVDLRTLLTILRAIHEVERCGDYMVNIAKATRRLYPHKLEPEVRSLIEKMRDQSVLQLETAIQAFADSDVAEANALGDMDDVMDDLQKDLLRWIFDTHMKDEFIQQGVQIALVGRYFERVADHAVNIGERVQFMVNGFLPPASS